MAALPQSGIEMVAQGASAYLNDIDRAAKATDTFTKGLGNAADKSGAFSQIVTGALRRVGEAAVEGLGMAARAAGDFLKDSVTSAADVEQTLAVMGATSGATAAQLEKVRDTAIALGGDLSLPATSAQDASEAMLELSKAGFTVDEAMAAAKGTLQLAAAAQISAGEAAAISAQAINAFGLAAEDAGHVADLLAGGANASSASMTDLAQGLQQGGFAFDAAGQQVDDLVVSLAALTNVGLTGSDAGTALKNAMMRLMNPTDKAAKLMAKLGINAYDAQGNMKPWPQLLEHIRKATAGMTQEQRNAALGTIFLSDGMKAMIPLLDMSAEEYAALEANVTKAGSAQEVAGAQTQGFNGAIAGLQSQMETMQLVIGTKLLPMLTPLIQQFSAGAAKVGEFVSTFLDLAPAIAESDNPLRTFFNVLRVSLDDTWNPMITAVQDFVTAISTIGGYITGQESSLAGLSSALAYIATTFGLTAPQAAGLVSSLGIFYDTIVTKVIPGAQELILWIGENAKKALEAFGGFLVDTVIPNLSTLATWLETNIPKAVDAATKVWAETIQPALQTFVDFLVGTAIPKLGELVAWLITSIPAAAQATADAWTTKVQPALTTANDYITGTLVPTLQVMNGILNNETPAAAGATADALNLKTIPAFTMLGDYITTQVIPILQGLGQIIQNELISQAQATADAFMKDVLPALETIANFIKDTAVGAWQALTQVGKDQNPVMQDLVGAFGAIAGKIDEATSAVKKFIEWCAKITVPSLVTPGSPTPLEIGMRGIAESANLAADAFASKFNVALAEMPTIQAAVATTTAAIAKPGIGGSSSTVNNSRSMTYAPVYGSGVQPPPAQDISLARSLAL